MDRFREHGPQMLKGPDDPAREFNRRLFGERGGKIASGIPGIPEAAVQIATAGVTAVGAGWAALSVASSNALADRAKEFPRTGQPESPLANTTRLNPKTAFEDVMELGTFQPRSEAGKIASDTVASAFAPIDKFANGVADKLGMGNPIVETAIYTLLIGGPTILFPARAGIKRRNARRNSAVQLEQRMNDLGITISANLRTELAAAADGATVSSKGQSLVAVQAELRAANDKVRGEVNAAYEVARGTEANVSGAGVKSLELSVKEALVDWDLDAANMGNLRAVVNEIAELRRQTEPQRIPGPNRTATGEFRVAQASEATIRQRTAQLQEIENIRRGINRKRVSTDAELNKGLSVAKKSLDDWLDQQFIDDMISGEPEAIQAWKNARSANQSYRERFRDNKVIRQLLEKDTTVEQMRNWIFGATKAGMGPEAAKVISQLKRVLGENSPEIAGLRSEFLFNIIEPLMGDTPNFPGFIARYDTLVRNNPSVLNALAIESRTPLKFLRDIAAASERSGIAPTFELDFVRAGSQVLFGHGIAKAGLKVRVATQAFRQIIGLGKSGRQAFLGEMLGYDHTAPFMSRKSVAAASVIIAEIEQSKEN